MVFASKLSFYENFYCLAVNMFVIWHEQMKSSLCQVAVNTLTETRHRECGAPIL